MKRIMTAIGAILLCAPYGVIASELKDAGLQITLSSADGKSDSRVSRLAALYVPEGNAASPFISKGPFKAEYTGYLTLEARRRLYFSAEGQGKLTMSIKVDDEKTIIQEWNGSFSKSDEGDRQRLNPGSYSFSLSYESPTEGDAFFRLYWRESRHEWPQEPIPPTYFSHTRNEILDASLLRRRGRQLLADLHCTKCHSAGEAVAMPELNADAPSFDGIGSRLHANWIADWVKDPKAMRPKARMPKVLHGDIDKAEDIAAYLATLKSTLPESPEGRVADGAQLFHDLGCIACHGLPDKNDKTNSDRISLNHVNRKFQEGALAEFLKEPGKHFAWGRMPDFGLSQQEAADLAAWLRSVTEAGKKTNSGDVAQGKKDAIAHGCLNCHAPDQAELNAPTLAKLKWSGGCIEGEFANFSLSDDDKKALLSIKGHLDSLTQSSPVEFSHRQVDELNCVACHKRDGKDDLWSQLEGETAKLNKRETVAHGLDQSRPILTWIGEKLNSGWSEDLLAAELNYKPRPWLAARMPAFKSRAALLAEGLAHEHGYSKTKTDIKKDDALAEAGNKLSGTAGFGCVVCHDFGTGKALAPFEVKGLNLGYAHDRLRYDYYLRWMQHPMRVVEGTKMPRYSSDGTSAISTLEGNANKQYDAIWHYASDGMHLEPPEGHK